MTCHLSCMYIWCLYYLSNVVPTEYKQSLIKVGDQHMKSSMEQVAGSDYMGSHWLASFLVYALETRDSI